MQSNTLAGTGVPMPQRETEIFMICCQLDGSINKASQAVNNLEDRLSRVMASFPEAPPANKKEPGLKTSLGNDLNAFRDRIESITERVERIMARLEI